MNVPVLTAVPDADREAVLVQAFEAPGSGMRVVKRCVDLADLLATAAAGTARAAVVAADLRRLDRDALSRLAVCGVAVVGLARDDADERRLRQLGVLRVLPSTAPPQAVAEAVHDALANVIPAEEPPPLDDTPEGEGRVVAVWGPTGAPGRTTFAVNLAAELAALGATTVLVDADVYGGAVAQYLGLLDEAPGLAAATRLAGNGLLDRPSLAGLAKTVSKNLRVLSGMTRADRWPELRPAAVENVLDLCRGIAEWTVVDCAFCLEPDSRRNEATLTVTGVADTVYAVTSADPISLQRLVRGLADLGRDLGRDTEVVVNRLRKGVMPGDPAKEIAQALQRYAGASPRTFLPYDDLAADRAVMRGQTLAEAAPHSALREAIRDEARRIGEPVLSQA